MEIKVIPNDNGNPPGKLADIELHLTEGLFEGLKLIGFCVWESRDGARRNVTFPERRTASMANVAASRCCDRSETRRRGSASAI